MSWANRRPSAQQIRASRSSVGFARRRSPKPTIFAEMPACLANAYIDKPRASRASRITSATAPQMGAGLQRGIIGLFMGGIAAKPAPQIKPERTFETLNFVPDAWGVGPVAASDGGDYTT